MRVVLTGITGLEKECIARALAEEAARQRGLPTDLNDRHTRRYIQVLSVEEEIKNTIGDLRPFLDQIVARERLRRWREAMERILRRVAESEHTVLCFHNVFYRRSNFFSCVDWDLLANYKPTVFVTLINDVYDVWQTINSREEKLKTNSYLHLPEILAWRSAEISATQNLAENLYVKAHRHGITPNQLQKLPPELASMSGIFGESIPHFVFAVKHPLGTLFQLLFRRDFLPCYASFPITKTRGDERGRAEIDQYRDVLRKSGFLTILDPLTIDEFRFVKLDKWVPGMSVLRDRWPMTVGLPMVNETPLTNNPFSGYEKVQLESFMTSVIRHLEARDYQLVSQATALVAYRPFYGGPTGTHSPPSEKPSGGVDKELMYALNESKLIYAVHPDEDRTPDSQVFSSIDFAVAHRSIEELLKELETAQRRWAERLSEHGELNTWE